MKKNFVNAKATINSVFRRHTRAVLYIDGVSAHSAGWMKELFWRHDQQPGLQSTEQHWTASALLLFIGHSRSCSPFQAAQRTSQVNTCILTGDPFSQSTVYKNRHKRSPQKAEQLINTWSNTDFALLSCLLCHYQPDAWTAKLESGRRLSDVQSPAVGGLKSFPKFQFFLVAAEHPVDIPTRLGIIAFFMFFHC